MSGPVARILLRYGSGALVAMGVFDSGMAHMVISDPDIARVVEVGVGVGLGAAAEFFYGLARKFGWSK